MSFNPFASGGIDPEAFPYYTLVKSDSTTAEGENSYTWTLVKTEPLEEYRTTEMGSIDIKDMFVESGEVATGSELGDSSLDPDTLYLHLVLANAEHTVVNIDVTDLVDKPDANKIPIDNDNITVYDDTLTVLKNNFGSDITVDTTVEDILYRIAKIVGEFEDTLENHESRITTNEEDIDKIENQIIDIYSKIDTIETEIDTLEQTVNDNYTDLSNKITSINNQITTINNQIEAIEGDISTIKTTLTNYGTRITTLESKVTTIEGNITTIEGNITTLESKVTTLESKVATIESNITTIKNNITSIENRLSTAETNITDIQTDIDEIWTAINNLKDIYVSAASYSDGTLTLTRANSTPLTVDLSELINNDEIYITGGELDSNTGRLTITRQNAPDIYINLGAFLSDTDTYVSGGTLSSDLKTLTLTKNDNSTVSIDLSAILTKINSLAGSQTDYGTISVSDLTISLDDAVGKFVNDDRNAEIFNDYTNNTAGSYAHAEGCQTTATASCSHAEGYKTSVTSTFAHVEGQNSIASGTASHAEGYTTTSSGPYSHAEGNATIASGAYSHAEGEKTTSSYHSSHAEGVSTQATAQAAHAEGQETVASGIHSHAEGFSTTASGANSCAAGIHTVAVGAYSHAEGNATYSLGKGSHAEGQGTQDSTTIGALGDYSHAEGTNTIASGEGSHAEGKEAEATGSYSHSEGFSTHATGNYAHAEGTAGTASGVASHAEGTSTYATGGQSHSEGYYTKASGECSHSGGFASVASGNCSFVHGQNLLSQNDYEVAFGAGNKNLSEDTYGKYGTAFTYGRQVLGSTDLENAGTGSNTLQLNINGSLWIKENYLPTLISENSDLDSTDFICINKDYYANYTQAQTISNLPDSSLLDQINNPADPSKGFYLKCRYYGGHDELMDNYTTTDTSNSCATQTLFAGKGVWQRNYISSAWTDWDLIIYNASYMIDLSNEVDNDGNTLFETTASNGFDNYPVSYIAFKRQGDIVTVTGRYVVKKGATLGYAPSDTTNNYAPALSSTIPVGFRPHAFITREFPYMGGSARVNTSNYFDIYFGNDGAIQLGSIYNYKVYTDSDGMTSVQADRAFEDGVAFGNLQVLGHFFQLSYIVDKGGVI